jgi:hypothetical protein
MSVSITVFLPESSTIMTLIFFSVCTSCADIEVKAMRRINETKPEIIRILFIFRIN